MDDAEIDGVAQAAGGGDHVVAEDALFFRPDADEGFTPLVVECVGFESRAPAACALT